MYKRMLICAGPMLMILLVGLIPSQASGADSPNVLFIAVDDLNDWIGVMGGHPQANTPNIDRLAAMGTLFTHAYCAAPACNPSRAALMTGIRPSTSGVYKNADPWRQLLPDAVTLPQHFMASGYTALGSGKIYHGAFPDPPSWDLYFPSKTKQKPSDPLPDGRPLNGIPRTSHFDWGPVAADDAEMGDFQVADWVIEQLGKAYDKPFFLACGMYRPHLPWYAPEKYFQEYPLDEIQLPITSENDLADIPAAGIKMAKPTGDHARVTRSQQWKKAVQGYLACISFTDTQIGRVLDAFESSPHRDNTILVFWTDHGWHLGEKEHWRKFALWEEATHTPMVVVAPGLSTAGTRCDRPVNLIDLYPTLVDLCGLPANDRLEGQSLVPLLKDPGQSWERPSLTTHGRNNHSLRSDRFRYIRYADGSEELYDHEADPREWKNLADDSGHSGVKQRLAKWLPTTNVPGIENTGKKNAGKKSGSKNGSGKD
ncbi:MAG: sulfatase [Rubripirellula sp.]|nr:sulfatase [Rubripirellula sp.]